MSPPIHPTTVDEYLADGCGRCPLGATPDCKVHNRNAILAALREIILQSELHEEIKRSVPCYTYAGKNILLLSAFKEFCAVSFFKGVLIDDTANILVTQGQNSQASRTIKCTTVHEVENVREILPSYIQQAIQLERDSKEVSYKTVDQYEKPDELTKIFAEDQAFLEAFEALTPGRQKGRLLHFSSAKYSITRTSRIEKAMPKIFEGKGMHER